MARVSPSVHPFLKGVTRARKSRRLRTLQHATSNASQRSLLLDLPPELRNIVYRLVLVEDRYINVAKVNKRVTMTRSKSLARILTAAVIEEPALLRTCRSIRNDAEQIYYALNIFVSPTWRLVTWMKRMTHSEQAMIRDIRYSHLLEPSELPELLLQMRDFHQRTIGANHSVNIGVDVLRVYNYLHEPETALTESDIKAKMDEAQWERYYELRQQEESRRSKKTEELLIEGGFNE